MMGRADGESAQKSQVPSYRYGPTELLAQWVITLQNKAHLTSWGKWEKGIKENDAAKSFKGKVVVEDKEKKKSTARFVAIVVTVVFFFF